MYSRVKNETELGVYGLVAVLNVLHLVQCLTSCIISFQNLSINSASLTTVFFKAHLRRSDLRFKSSTLLSTVPSGFVPNPFPFTNLDRNGIRPAGLYLILLL